MELISNHRSIAPTSNIDDMRKRNRQRIHFLFASDLTDGVIGLASSIGISFARLLKHLDTGPKARTCRGTHRSILILQKLLRLGRPGHKLTIKTKQIRVELRPEIFAIHRLRNPIKQARFDRTVVKKASPCASVNNATTITNNAESLFRSLFASANQ